MRKNIYIISGCNGAGKTTASYTVLPEILQCREYVNADEIAKGLSPFNPELAIQRVVERVSKGGHNIPIDVIRRRYKAGICNLFNLFMKEVDLWIIYDNSCTPRSFVAKGGKKISNEIVLETTFNKIKDYVG